MQGWRNLRKHIETQKDFVYHFVLKVVKSYSGEDKLYSAQNLLVRESSQLHSLPLSTAALISIPFNLQNSFERPDPPLMLLNGPEKATCGVVGEATRRDLPTGDHNIELLGSTESLTARLTILPSVGC